MTNIQSYRRKSLHQLTTQELVRCINDQDQLVASAVKAESENISLAIDAASKRFQNNGRLIYCGAGTSGRLGALDAIELQPTYGLSFDRAFGIMAGGKKAMFEAIEGAEDNEQLAIEDLKSVSLSQKDILIGIAASGNTPYTVASLSYGNSIGALTIGISCNKKGKMASLSSISITPEVGPEIIQGSTRMKAGTAQKMILNMISTGIMVKAGFVYKDYMINVQATNHKLKKRAQNIVYEVTGAPKEDIENLLEQNRFSVPETILMIKRNISFSTAHHLLNQHNGNLGETLSMSESHLK